GPLRTQSQQHVVLGEPLLRKKALVDVDTHEGAPRADRVRSVLEDVWDVAHVLAYGWPGKCAAGEFFRHRFLKPRVDHGYGVDRARIVDVIVRGTRGV